MGTLLSPKIPFLSYTDKTIIFISSIIASIYLAPRYAADLEAYSKCVGSYIFPINPCGISFIYGLVFWEIVWIVGILTFIFILIRNEKFSSLLTIIWAISLYILLRMYLDTTKGFYIMVFVPLLISVWYLILTYYFDKYWLLLRKKSKRNSLSAK